MTSANTTESAPRKGLLAWVRNLFSRRPKPVVPVEPTAEHGTTMPIRLSECRTLADPIRVPADGGVFEFAVHAEIVFSAKGMTAARLASRADAYLDSERLSIQRAIWPVGRRFLPHHADAAENAMNEAMREGWCHDENGEVISCQPTVRVTADPRVLANQLPLWERLIGMDLQVRTERRRIDVIDDLLTRWRDLIKKFDDDDGFISVHAARLVDSGYADVVRRLTDERRAAAEDLSTVLRDASNVHTHLGLYEFTTAYDTALRGMQRMLGLAAAHDAATDTADGTEG